MAENFTLLITLLMIECFTGNYIVTGRTDGVATVWVMGDLPEVLRLKPLFVEKQKTYEKIHSNISREEFVSARMDSMVDVLYHKVMDLQGHLQAITRVSFSNLGDRILTGSRLDGSVRVWSFSGYYDKYQHYVINLSEEGEDHNAASRSRQVKGRGRQRQVKKKSKSELLAACWTCDDSNIVTLQSVPSQSDPSDKVFGSKLKVWNSMNGMLMRIIEVSQKSKTDILVAHPKIPSIVVTAGSDGQINMWDIDLRLKYFHHDVKIPI
jgi:WD40 repeat protein